MLDIIVLYRNNTALACKQTLKSDFAPWLRYGTYKLVQEMPGGEKLVGFTRILHRTQPDVLMTTNEVITI